MNGHRQVVNTNKEKLVSNHANQHNLNFYSCYTAKAKSYPKEQCIIAPYSEKELAYQHNKLQTSS